jgi:tetratricopeptide (TPR) repeat protein
VKNCIRKMSMERDNIPEINTIWEEARNHIKSGRTDKAIEIYKYILVRYAVEPVAAEYANAYLGDIFLTLQQLDPAEKHIRKAIEYQPEKAAYRYILGFVFSHRSQWEKAIAEFQLAVDREPDNAEYLRGLGWAIHESGDRQKGLDLLHQADRLSPNSTNILTDLAVAYLGTDDQKARQLAEQAVAADPHNSQAQKLLNLIQTYGEDTSRTPVRAQRESDLRAAYDTVIYRFKVSLKDNPEIWRIIEIEYIQLLSTLHKGIMKAFERREDRPYSFFFHEKQGDRQNEFAASLPGISGKARPAKSIQVNSILLYQDEGEKFSYLFDYENKCWHEVELIQVMDKVTRAVYPRVVKKQGKYPATGKKGG